MDSNFNLKHIAFIMDGNGRWAARRGLPRPDGHREGIEALKRVLKALDGRVPVASFYAFSTENWRRPQKEIKAIFALVEELNEKYLSAETDYAVNFFGDIDALPASVRRSVETAREKTKNNRGMLVNIMLNYGGRGEIVRAAKRLAESKAEFTEENLSAMLYTGYLPDPDLIVRTGGEKRLSNFMTFQSVYSELLFSDRLWPDMDGDDVDKIIKEYGTRKRTFGR
ncbi:MAG: di-trans,poly-cis-decaprenylcistransferase [Clostridiales bacterium]|jgi:undecaprenyl diphosphate synthase|nr:di-trans,poly-cis-decaprenylcistransferase [Clostridiales bacterium]